MNGCTTSIPKGNDRSPESNVPRLNLISSKIRTHPSFNACSCYMKVSKGSNQKQQRKSGNTIFPIIRAPDKMRICVFHSNLNVKNSIIFGNVRIMYAKHFPDTQLCPVSKRICFVYILMECGLLPIFP